MIGTARTERRGPSLHLDDWIDTYATLHMWTQIVGKSGWRTGTGRTWNGEEQDAYALGFPGSLTLNLSNSDRGA